MTEYNKDNYEQFVFSRLSEPSKVDLLGTCAAGLADEVSELFTELKNLWGFVDETNTFIYREELKSQIKNDVIKELGDVCFYVAVGLNHFNIPFKTCVNITKDPLKASLLNDTTRFIFIITSLIQMQGLFCDLIKKVKYQGKQLEEPSNITEGTNNYKLISYLNNIVHDLKTIAIMFDVQLDEVITANIEKLSMRYPKGFSVNNSENRK